MNSIVSVGSLVFACFQRYRAAGPNEDWELYHVLMRNHNHFDNREKSHLVSALLKALIPSPSPAGEGVGNGAIRRISPSPRGEGWGEGEVAMQTTCL